MIKSLLTPIALDDGEQQTGKQASKPRYREQGQPSYLGKPADRPSGEASIQPQELWEFRKAVRMQNAHYAPQLLHLLTTGLGGRQYGSRKALQLILSFSWKSTANYSG